MTKIALDFDSVLSDTMKSWTKKYNEKHNTNFSKDHIREWEFWNQEEFGFDRNYAHTFFKSSWEDWKNLPPTEADLDKNVRKLLEFGSVNILTNVDKDYIVNVKNWLNHHDIPEIDVIPTEKKNKAEFNYDLYIDDDPKLPVAAHAKNKNTFVYHQKWNKLVKTNEKISRINNLTDAINEISNKGI